MYGLLINRDGHFKVCTVAVKKKGKPLKMRFEDAYSIVAPKEFRSEEQALHYWYMWKKLHEDEVRGWWAEAYPC